MFKLIAAFTIVFSQIFTTNSTVEIWGELIPFMETEIRQDYVAPATEYARGHRGIDVEVPIGESVFSPASGKVSFIGLVVDRNVLTITTNRAYLASFEPICSDLELGQIVQKGQEIGYHCAPKAEYQYHCESCVHESTRNPFGYLSPLYMMGRLEPSVLES